MSLQVVRLNTMLDNFCSKSISTFLSVVSDYYVYVWLDGQPRCVFNETSAELCNCFFHSFKTVQMRYP